MTNLDPGDGPGVPATPDCTASRLFDALWTTLREAIGPTATATLLQRSVKRAAAKNAAASDLLIRRDEFLYLYTVPAEWHRDTPAPLEALRAIVGELVPLLTELTGVVVVRRLAEVPELARCGVLTEASWQ